MIALVLPFPFSNESSAVSNSFVAAPYWADIDNSVTGEIWYETHTAGGENSTESELLLEKVSAFIREHHDQPTFNGSWMLVATWNESFPFSPSQNTTEVSPDTVTRQNHCFSTFKKIQPVH